MKRFVITIIISLATVTAFAQITPPTTITQLYQKIDEWIVPNTSKQITPQMVNALYKGVANLMNKYGMDSAYTRNDTLFLTRHNGAATIAIKLNGALETDPTVPTAAKTLTDADKTYWNGKQNALTAGPAITIVSNTINAKNDSAAWNAAKVQGRPISATAPTVGQVLQWDGSNWVPATVAGGGGTDSQTLSYTAGTRTLAISGGNNVVLPTATTSTAGLATALQTLRNDSSITQVTQPNDSTLNFYKLNGALAYTFTFPGSSVDFARFGDSIRLTVDGVSKSVYAPTSGGGGGLPIDSLITATKISGDSFFVFRGGAWRFMQTINVTKYNILDWGMHPNNTPAQNSTLLKKLLDTMYNRGGGIVFTPSTTTPFAFADKIKIPRSNTLLPTQPSFLFEGASTFAAGAGAVFQGGSMWDLRYTADSNDAQIDTRGVGWIGVQKMTLIHTQNVNRTRYFHTTNTSGMIEDVAFIGHSSDTSQMSDCIILGGKNGGTSDSTYNSPFQGYHFNINRCYTNRNGALVIGQRYCNNINVTNNTAWNSSGGRAFIISNSYDNAQANTGWWVSGSLIQTNMYVYGILGHGMQNSILHANSFDGTGGHINVVYLTTQSEYNSIHAGKGEVGKAYLNVEALDKNIYYGNGQNEPISTPFGVWASGPQSKYTGGTSPRVYAIASTVNNHYWETFGATEAGIRINDDYVFSVARSGTNRNSRLNGSGNNTYWSDGATFLSSASGRETWIGNDGFTFNFYTFNGTAHYRGTDFNLAADTRFRFTPNTGSAASGHDVQFGRSGIGLFRVYDAAGTGYGNIEIKTETAGDNTNKAASTAFVQAAVATTVVNSTYNPTLYNVTNIASSSITVCDVQLINGYYYITGELTVDPTAAGDTQVDLSLPVSSAVSSTKDIVGHGDAYDVIEPARIYGDTTNNRAIVRFFATNVGPRTMGVTLRIKYTAP